MALRLRRGLDIERHSVIFAEGEPLYTTDTKKIYIGDGATPGGLLVSGLLSLSDDETPRLGGSIDLNSHDIIGTGNVNIVGDITLTGSLNAGFIEADYRGSIFGNDSSVIVDSNNNTIHGNTVSTNNSILVNVTTGEIDLSSTILSSVQDVGSYGNSVGEVLTWNGSAWIGQLFGGGTPAADALLQYDAALGYVGTTQIKGTNGQSLVDIAANTINITNQNLEELQNIFIDSNSIEADDILTWDGTNWTHKQLTLTNFNIALNGLDDVFVPSANINDVLTYDGSNWISRTITIDDLDDVYIPSVNANDVLTYDGSNWISRTITIDDLDDVDVPGATINDVLTYDGSNWISQAPQQVGGNTLVGLDDVSIGSATNGNLLTYDGNNWTAQPFTALLNDIDDVFIQADLQNKDVLMWNGYYWTNEPLLALEGTFQGDVLSQDSTIMINSYDQSIYALDLTADNGTFDNIIGQNINISQAVTANRIFVTDCVTQETVIERGSNPALLINRVDDSIAFAGSSERIGMIRWSSTSTLDTPNEIGSCYILGYSHCLLIAHSNNAGTVAEEFTTLAEGNMHVGGVTPATEKLQVTGNATVSGFVQFGSYTTTERDAIAAQSGMVLFNTTTGKFQGYAVNQWVDLH